MNTTSPRAQEGILTPTQTRRKHRDTSTGPRARDARRRVPPNTAHRCTPRKKHNYTHTRSLPCPRESRQNRCSTVDASSSFRDPNRLSRVHSTKAKTDAHVAQRCSRATICMVPIPPTSILISRCSHERDSPIQRNICSSRSLHWLHH